MGYDAPPVVGRPLTFSVFGNHRDLDVFEHFMKMLILTLWKGGYPHEIISLLYTKGFFTGYSSDPHESTADGSNPRSGVANHVIREKSEIPLIILYEDLADHYSSQFDIYSETVETCFARLLFIRMYNKVGEAIKPSDRSAKARWTTILGKLVGLTVLRDYFDRDPEHNLDIWAGRVRKRVRDLMIEEDWFNRPLESLLEEINS